MKEARTVRKNINFTVDLVSAIYSLSKELNIDFSKFVREATAEYIRNFEKTRLEAGLKEGYQAKAKLNLEISEDFKHVDGENV